MSPLALPLVPGHDVSSGIDAGPEGEAGHKRGEVPGEEHAAERAAVQRGQRVEGLPVRRGQRRAEQRGDEPRVQPAVQAVAPVQQLLHLGRLVQGGQTGKLFDD